ncbi:MAG: hypothetical protein HZB19_17030 [Chloroflexi bacterium]|nr:hypothetical protein [Chloroflexota bacterium]
MTAEPRNLSSLELLLLNIDRPETFVTTKPLRKGETCPQCGQGQLDYNGLLQLECPKCGFVNSEGGGCT